LDKNESTFYYNALTCTYQHLTRQLWSSQPDSEWSLLAGNKREPQETVINIQEKASAKEKAQKC
jgi:hypothetical protein